MKLSDKQYSTVYYHYLNHPVMTKNTAADNTWLVHQSCQGISKVDNQAQRDKSTRRQKACEPEARMLYLSEFTLSQTLSAFKKVCTINTRMICVLTGEMVPLIFLFGRRWDLRRISIGVKEKLLENLNADEVPNIEEFKLARCHNNNT